MEEKFHLGTKALIQNSEGQILVLEANVKGYNRPIKPHWDLPGGRVHKGESFEQGLKRELEEEIGITNLTIHELFDASLSNHTVLVEEEHIGLILFTYIVEIPPNSTIELTDDEHLSFKWINPVEAAELLSDKFSRQFTEKLSQLKKDTQDSTK